MKKRNFLQFFDNPNLLLFASIFRCVVALYFILLTTNNVSASGFTITLYNGRLYGPGNFGTHDIGSGTLNNFVVTAPLQGFVPLFNNGGDSPNVSAEKKHVGPLDGKLSDGTPFNENVDAAFTITVNEPETQYPVTLLIGSISEEHVTTDSHGNLLFKLNAAFDTGFASDVVKIPIEFTTGSVTVPLANKTKNSINGGHNNAGPFPSGSVHIGRLGDKDGDGFLDGVFTLSGNTPDDLVLAEGDPVLIVRPFKSNIPVRPSLAFFYELNGLVENFPKHIDYFYNLNNVDKTISFITDFYQRIEYLEINLHKIKKRMKALTAHSKGHAWVGQAEKLIAGRTTSYKDIDLNLKQGKKDNSKDQLKLYIDELTQLHKTLLVLYGNMI